MSSIANWSYVEGPATVWPSAENDEWGQPVAAAPYLIPAVDFLKGGEFRRDESGVEFVARTTVFFEAEFGSAVVPKRGWKVLPGNHLSDATPPPEAEVIRLVEAFPMEKFGAGEVPDWAIHT